MRKKNEDNAIKIYNAAVKLINTEGFQGTSMAKIAKEAGIAAATIYLYFENKEDMLNKLYIHLKEEMSKAYMQGKNELNPDKETFQNIWLNHYHYITENPQEFKFLENFSNCHLIECISQKYALSFYQPLLILFDRARQKGIIKDISNNLIYANLFIPLGYLVKQALQYKKTIGDQELKIIFETSWSAIKK